MVSKPSQLTGLLFALLTMVSILLVAHQIGKFPDDPPIGTPWAMFDNLAFCVALGFDFPWPKIGAFLILVVFTSIAFLLGKWIGKKIWKA